MKIERLVRKAQKGDKNAFEKLFQNYKEEIYRTAFIYMRTQEDSLDIVQEVAYKAFKSIKFLKEPKYFKTWLIKIVITCSIDMLRQHNKIFSIKPEHMELITIGKEEDIALSLYLQTLIEEISETEKSVILLKYFHDYTLNEIAITLDMPLGTIKTTLYRALEKLRKRLNKEDIL
ncbi:sigma-70 family RNA polymerase sigma factor [Peribacillus simplex]|uniref:sigma-70 family RNA polymerase sigma factor n=1 Tax=Peribacillus simplex TaxID=1478 RepID=UPI0011DDD24F|nr:sigma-70 family RNA polymerase sigma factor [Peribacillus simplex]